MELWHNGVYRQDIQQTMKAELPWEKLTGKKVLITGATGMIGRTLIDILMFWNEIHDGNIEIIAMGRSESKAKERLGEHWERPSFHFIECNIKDIMPEMLEQEGKIDYIIHAASTTHPIAYATEPVDTMTVNFLGTSRLLDYAVKHPIERFIFLSSVEIYGENRGDAGTFSEDYCGYIDCNTLRAGYPESKRASEALCQAYRKQHGMDIVIPRLSRVYGPSMQQSDSKAIAQFIKKAVKKEDIILKSDGSQLYSYTYSVDAAMGVLYTLLMGVNGEAYNIADPVSGITLKELANILAHAANIKVVYQMPDSVEKAGYSKATRAVLNADKIWHLGWRANTHIEEGLRKTLRILDAK